MGELQSLGYSLYVVGGVIDGGGRREHPGAHQEGELALVLWLPLSLRTREAHEAWR